MIFVTGGAGFIGSNFILNWFNISNEPILNIDKLTYAGNLQNLVSLSKNPNYLFVKADIGDSLKMQSLLDQYKPRAVLNFAAESHVDNSISSPKAFIETNVMGTFCILDACRQYWINLDSELKSSFRFIHVSTDEVYGSLEEDEAKFTELSRYQPNSPYSASKASSDHLVRSYFHTFDFPVITTNCSNNYGPYQFPEKLIPVVIQNALKGKRFHCMVMVLMFEIGFMSKTTARL
jgi:dTDP-glucose 4,6-dehydratase